MNELEKMLDADGVAITPGAVLRSVDDGERGVVVRIINPGDKYGPLGCGVGDCLIQLRPGTTRVTNRYTNWRRVKHDEQTFRERYMGWFYSDKKWAGCEDNSPDIDLAISGIMALLPEDAVDWEYGPIPSCLENALQILVGHMESLTGQKA